VEDLVDFLECEWLAEYGITVTITGLDARDSEIARRPSALLCGNEWLTDDSF
jgi:hypothetical protein